MTKEGTADDDEEYCGLVCGFLLADQQEILDQCIEHAKYDPKFAPVMVDKLIDLCNKAKNTIMMKQNEGS